MSRNRRWVLETLASTVLLTACEGASPGTDSPAGDDSTSGDTDSPNDTFDSGRPDTDMVPPEIVYEPGTWDAGGTVDEAAFPFGLQAGDATPTEISLSVRTSLPEVTIEVVEQREEGWRVVFRELVETSGPNAHVVVTGLEPGARYRWVGRADAARSIVGSFRTSVADDDDRILRFGATSCLGGNYPWPCLSRAAEEDLDAFILLGDTIYADWGAASPVSVKWDEALSQQGMAELCATTSLIATWDDHEVWNNWSPENTPADQWQSARQAFRAAIPQRRGPDDAIWRSVRWGNTAEFFVLDCRGERVDGDYISAAQMTWLKAALTASTARFKFILNSVPITDLSFIPIVGLIEQNDRWQGYADQRRELVDHCADIDGVIFLSGDFHVGAATFIDPPDLPSGHLQEILVGPGGSAISNTYRFVPQGGRLPRVVTENNFALFACDPTTGVVTVDWINNDGHRIRSYELTV